ncbi:MAG: acyltransferase [Bacteroidales bacterium]|nr:acyltransferase [Bacteroidales bacterium]
MADRYVDLDALKGVAIIGIVLFHLGVVPFGFLGVDIFLVINGFLIAKGIQRDMGKGSFSYCRFLMDKAYRLWPLVIMACFVALTIGYFTMLPDNYENLGQSVVASSAFGQNVLSSINTNYWDIRTGHKPLMHMWYVSLLMQCYVIFPLLVWVILWVGKRSKIAALGAILTLILWSLSGPFGSTFGSNYCFYMLPCRLYEFMLGALVALALDWAPRSKVAARWPFWTAFLALIILCGFGQYLSFQWMTLTVCVITAVAIWVVVNTSEQNRPKAYKILAAIGIMSYSIFIWHQVVIAFYRHLYHPDFMGMDIAVLLGIIVVISCVSYRWIESKMATRKRGVNSRALIVTCLCGVAVFGSGFYVYARAGVMRDVPELGITTANAHLGMHGEYCDRIYDLGADFVNNGKTKVLGIGNSFMRDFLNVLLESEYADSLDIHYLYSEYLWSSHADYLDIINSADIIFMINQPEDFADCITKALLQHPRVYGVGVKYFGESNGYTYSHRYSPDYYDLRVAVPQWVISCRESQREYWGDHYVDMLAPLLKNDCTVPLFTDDHKFISQDCLHLTQSGAKYYAKLLDLAPIWDDTPAPALSITAPKTPSNPP